MDSYVVIYPAKKIPQDVVATIRSDVDADLPSDVWEDYGSVWAEQLQRIEEARDGWYFFAVFDKDHNYLGGVFLFLKNLPEDIEPSAPVFQGIAKSRLGVKSNIRLNSFLIPAIINFLSSPNLLETYSAPELSYTRVHVSPYGKQREILLKYFGFKEGALGLHKDF